MSTFLTKHWINGTEIRPVNAHEIGFKLDWTGDPREAELTIDTIILANKAKALVMEHLATIGPFEGLPYTVQAGTTILEYYIDFTENPELSGEGDSDIEVTIKRRKAADWFFKQADALSFESINKTHPITTIKIPYLIVRDNQLEMLIMLAIATYTMVKALIEGIRDVVTATTELIAAATPNAGVPPSFNTGAIIGAALKLVARLIYVAAIIIALIDLSKQIIELLFPPIRKLNGTQVLHLIQRGCQKLGFDFSSTILEEEYSRLAIMPTPLKKKSSENILSIIANLFTLDNGSYTRGYPTARDTTPTLGSLIDAMQTAFNAKVRIINGTVHLERRDYWQLQATQQVTNTLTLQNVRENRYGYNIAEAWKRYYIHLRYDPSDFHTMDRLEETDAEYSTEPLTVINQDLVSIKGLVEKAVPFAYGIRKPGLTFQEEAALPFAKAADEVVNFFGGSSSLEAKILGRVGVTMIGQQYYTVTKLLYQVNGRQPENVMSKIGAPALYHGWHYINEVKDNFKTTANAPIKLSTSQFDNILLNNYAFDQNGSPLEILTFEWINETKTAEIEYAELSDEGDNTETIIIDE